MSIAHLRQITDDFFNSYHDDLEEMDYTSSKILFKSILDNIDELIFICDENGNVIESNKQGKDALDSIPDSINICNISTVKVKDTSYNISSVELPLNRRACIARAIYG